MKNAVRHWRMISCWCRNDSNHRTFLCTASSSVGKYLSASPTDDDALHWNVLLLLSCWDQQNHLPVSNCIFLYSHDGGVKKVVGICRYNHASWSWCTWAWLAPKFACCSLWHKILELSPRTARTGVGNKFDTPRQSPPMIFGWRDWRLCS